jgi:hypothetical protein
VKHEIKYRSLRFVWSETKLKHIVKKNEGNIHIFCYMIINYQPIKEGGKSYEINVIQKLLIMQLFNTTYEIVYDNNHKRRYFIFLNGKYILEKKNVNIIFIFYLILHF